MARLLTQTVQVQWTQPGMERRFSNEELLFDFFQEAMAGVVLAHTSLDNFANELMDEDFEFVDPDDGSVKTRLDLESNSGLELRLSLVATQTTGKANLRSAEPGTWERVVQLKALRDDISHAKRMQTHSGTEWDQTIFSRLLNAGDLRAHLETIESVMAHYGAS